MKLRSRTVQERSTNYTNNYSKKVIRKTQWRKMTKFLDGLTGEAKEDGGSELVDVGTERSKRGGTRWHFMSNGQETFLDASRVRWAFLRFLTVSLLRCHSLLGLQASCIE